jgi:hypothetical protein
VRAEFKFRLTALVYNLRLALNILGVNHDVAIRVKPLTNMGGRWVLLERR